MMATNNINNLGATQSQLTTEVGRTSPTGASALQAQLTSGNPIDWFSDINSGKSLPIEAKEQYAPGTSIEKMVDDIIGHLGLTNN